MTGCNGHELMAGCNAYRCDGHELGQSLGDGEGQGGLACCSPCGCKESHDWATEQNNVLKKIVFLEMWKNSWILICLKRKEL